MKVQACFLNLVLDEHVTIMACVLEGSSDK